MSPVKKVRDLVLGILSVSGVIFFGGRFSTNNRDTNSYCFVYYVNFVITTYNVICKYE